MCMFSIRITKNFTQCDNQLRNFVNNLYDKFMCIHLQGYLFFTFLCFHFFFFIIFKLERYILKIIFY